MNTSIGIFRAIDVRFAHIEFAQAFHNFKPVFVANIPSNIKEFAVRNRITHFDLKLVPRFSLDPIYPLLKKTDFTPWLQFEGNELEKITSSMKIFEIYEPYFFYSSQIADLAKKKDIPLVTEIWTSFPEHPSRYMPPYSWLVKNVLQKTDLVVLRSKRAANFVRPYNIPESKKHVIYHGVNLKRFFPAKKTHERIRILFVGALASHKGLDDLLAVFPALVDKYPNKLDLVICGVGPMQKQIERAAMTLPIDYYGFVPNLDLAEIYRSVDIYCQPSKDYFLFGVKGGEEFAGYTFMEALASGLPIVATHCGGISEIVGNDNSLILQGKRDKLFSALDQFIADRSLRKTVGLQNRKRAEELFNLSKQVNILETIIKQRFR